MDNKELEKLFQEKLRDHGETPDPRVWNRIRSSLDEKKTRRVIPIWWRLGAAAAALAGVLFLVNPWEDISTDTPSVTDIETQDKTPVAPDNRDPKGEASFEKSVPEAAVADRDNGNKEVNTPASGALASDTPANLPKKQEKKPDFIASDRASEMAQSEILSEGSANDPQEAGISADRANRIPKDAVVSKLAEDSDAEVAAVSPQTKDPQTSENPKTTDGDENKISIFEAAEAQQTVAETADKGGKWAVGPSLAPVYFDSFGDGSPIASNFVNNTKSGSVNMSYGLQVSYKVSPRLSIRSGIHRVDYGYNTEEVGFTSSPIAQSSSLIRTISYSENSKSLVVHSTASGATEPQQPAATDITAPSPARQGQMVQEFGYLEVPVEMQYTLIDKKWGLNLIGGMSSLFLMENSVSLESSGTITEVGESNNMNDLNFSTNLGFGVFYRLNPRLELNLLPMFKYQLNTFSQTEGNFRPYSIGVYSGLSFRF